MSRLRRSDPSAAGIRRRRRGRGFQYLAPDGSTVTDPEVLERIRGLVLPPAWTDVWICPWPNGHIQATGRDAAGRLQYRYHDRWTSRRAGEKWLRARSLGRALPEVRDTVRTALGGRGLTETRVLACAVRLLDLGLLRAGSETYARENDSYGLATVLREHVCLRRGTAELVFPAKSGMEGHVIVHDPAAVDVLRSLLRRPDPSPELLGWWSPADRSWHDVRSEHVNAHVKLLTGSDLTAKDFRTWHASVLMALALARAPEATSATGRKRVVREGYREVASALGNTPAVARGSYVDPATVDLYRSGALRRTSLDRLRRDDAEPYDLVPVSASSALLELLS